jgi:signal recognition particle receptor subunit beta
VELKHRERIVQIKVVYYGPPVGGKTTNLQMLHAAAEQHHRGEFISVSSAQDRTILFDLLPLKGVGLHGFEIRFQLVAVPGQVQFAQTRRLVTSGADAVVFVANSAADRLNENVTSLREMTEHLVMNQLDPATIPLVFQHNKRDLPSVIPSKELQEALSFREAPHLSAVAIRGEGVLETLRAIVEQTMRHLMGRYQSLSLSPDETVEDWTAEALHRVFGGDSIVRETPPEGRSELEDRRLVQVSVLRARDADDSRGMTVPLKLPRIPGDDTKPPRVRPAPLRPDLAETYAQVSMDLSLALDRTREQRDEARRRLDQLEHALAAIEAVELGRSAEEDLREVLQHIAAGGGSRGASLLALGPNRTLLQVAGVGLPEDPFLRLDDGKDVVRRTFAALSEPTLLDPETCPEVARAVAPLRPRVHAVAAVPVRSALGLHGFVLLYYGWIDPLPSAAILAHLRGLGRMLASWFSVHRALTLGATSRVAQHVLPEVERAAQLALDLVRMAAHDPEGAVATLERAELKLVRVIQELARVNGTERAVAPPAAAPLPPSPSTPRR